MIRSLSVITEKYFGQKHGYLISQFLLHRGLQYWEKGGGRLSGYEKGGV